MKRAEAWVQLASERLDKDTRCVIGLGNDDFDELAEVFSQGPTQCPPDGLIEMDGFWFGTVGWSNVTPWRTHREKSEADLGGLVAALELPDASRTIWNIHVPPYGSTLDIAPRLSAELQVELVGGTPDFVPVGSTAVAAGIRQLAAVAEHARSYPREPGGHQGRRLDRGQSGQRVRARGRCTGRSFGYHRARSSNASWSLPDVVRARFCAWQV